MPTFLFLNKPFLLGLFATVIPLLIHLFTRKKARKLDFSTVDFIRDVAKRETKRLRLRNLLLMILRTAAITAFVLGMARPALVGPFLRSKGSTAVAIVLDNSASMGSLKGGKDLFEYACDAAREIFGGLSQKDEGGLIPVCPPSEGTPESVALVAGSARLAGMVGLVALSNGSSSPREAIATAYSLLEGTKSINKELFIVSDFQRSQWQKLERSQSQRGQPQTEQPQLGKPQQEQAQRGRPQREQRQLGEPHKEQLQRKGIRTTLVPISQSPPGSPLDFPLDNLSIEKAEIVPLAEAQEQMLEFMVVNHGRSTARGVPVRLSSGGKDIVVKYVDVERGGSAKVSLKLAVGSREKSSREIDIVLPPDVFPLDNTYFLAVQPPEQIDVLIVSEEEGLPAGKVPGESASGMDFVSLALRPTATGAAGNLWGFIPHRVAVEGLNETDLRRAKCVILENVSKLSARSLELLGEFKNAGGKLLIVLGDRVDIRYYNDKLLPALFPARLVGIEGTSEGHGSFFSLFATIASHPILRSFEVSRGEAISGARFYRLIKAEGLGETRVVAEFSEGLPALLEAKGALLFTSSFEPEWNDLVVSGVFLPLLHEMLRYLCGGGPLAGRDFHPGDVLEEEFPAGQEASLSLVDPTGKELRISKTKLGASLLVRSESMNGLGIYRLLAGHEELSVFSVNIDPAESQLDPLSKRELLRMFGGANIISDDSRGELAGAARPGQELWPFFLVLCLCFLVAELLVARSIAPSE
jgi:hypothetical protein